MSQNIKLIFIIAIFGFGCTPEKPKNDKIVVVEDGFRGMSINNLTKKSLTFKLKDLPQTNKLKYIQEHFIQNQEEAFVNLGKSYERPEAWFYFEVKNVGKSECNLTLISDHIRSDELNTFLITEDEIQEYIKLKRDIPISKRPYHNYDFAIPVSLKPGEEKAYLLQSIRTVGFNEVILTLEEENYYYSHYNSRFIANMMLLLTAVVTSIFLLILGVLYQQKIFLSVGVYLIFLVFALLGAFSFQDNFHFPSWINLTANNFAQWASVFSAFFAFPMVFQFSLQKKYRFQKVLFVFYWIVLAGNLLTVILINFAPSYIEITSINFQIFIFLTIVSIILAIVKFTIDTKRYLFLLAALIGLGSNIAIGFFRMLFSKDYPFSVMLEFSVAPIAIIILALACIKEGEVVLMSKLQSEERVNSLKLELANLRKDEIENIGRHLHDNVGNSLASILGFLNLKKVNITRIKAMLIEVINEVRVISHSFVKDDNLPILSKLENLVERFNEFSKTDFKLNDFSKGIINELEVERQLNLYLIIQELLTNCLKHAYASEVTIQIFHNDDKTWISIEDDGIGIHKETQKAGIGLKNIEKRAQLSDFKIVFDSSKNGTNTNIELSNQS